MGLPKLTDYLYFRPGWEYWKYWPNNPDTVGKSRIDGHKLKEMANQAGFPDKQQLDKVVVDLTGGARTGCRGKFRDKSDCSNAPSAFQYGEQYLML